jgi:hypothetical protein
MHMTNSIFINAVLLLFLVLASLAYLLFIANYVPDKYALVINFMLVPLLFGCVGFVLFKEVLPIKLLLLAIIPLVHVLYFGADSTKPGLENMIASIEFIFICIGVVLSYFAKKYLFS